VSSASLQWGGRFVQPPDPALLAFGSSLEDDLVLAPYDVACSHGHVDALQAGAIIDKMAAEALHAALNVVESEIFSGAFAQFARETGAEDVHGAIDARVRQLCPNGEGDRLHSGRSRNDQVATTLALYAADRGRTGARESIEIARMFIERAEAELQAETLVGAVTHMQPAQPVLLAFWLLAAAEPFARAARRFADASRSALAWCPLGSSAVAGSTLPLDRAASCRLLGFAAPSRNAMDAIGTRDAVLDVAHAYVRAVVDASRPCSDFILWATPAYGYVRLGDASSTGSSLMPQKRNPDPFELVRGGASELLGLYNGSMASLAGLPLSYQRDLQQTKRMAILAVERGAAMLQAFARAFADLTFVREKMNANADAGFAVATDVADALILAGASARRAHELVGAAVRRAELEGRELTSADLSWLASNAGIASLDAPLDARGSVRAKRTPGSTSPQAVRASTESLRGELDRLKADL
jgi:argininosuccinate lyase